MLAKQKQETGWSKSPESSLLQPVREEISVSAFRDICIHFPGDVFLLAVWLVASNEAESTPTCKIFTTLSGLAHHFVSVYGFDGENALSAKIFTTLSGLAHHFVSVYGFDGENALSASKVLSIFAAHNIVGNPSIKFDMNAESAATSRDTAVNVLSRLMP